LLIPALVDADDLAQHIQRLGLRALEGIAPDDAAAGRISYQLKIVFTRSVIGMAVSSRPLGVS